MELTPVTSQVFNEIPLDEEELFAIKREGLFDPVFFSRYFLRHHFGGDEYDPSLSPILARHQQGMLAVLTGKTDFLWRYGSVSWLMENFFRSNSKLRDKETKQLINLGTIFPVRVRKTGQQLTSDHVRQLEENYSPDELQEYLEIPIVFGSTGTLFIIPRGFAKTTTIGVAGSIYLIVYQLFKFIMYVSEASSHAKMQCESIRTELDVNQRLRAVFGILRPERADNERWSNDFFETTTHISFVPKGRGMQIRGTLTKGRRPDCVIFDDLEDKESVATETQRKKTKTWFFGDLLPALPKKKFVPHSRVVGLGTMLGQFCLLEDLAADQDFTTIRLANIDINNKPLWPEAEGEKEIAKEKALFARMAQSHIYYLEKESRWVPESVGRFKPEYFNYDVIPASKVVSWAIYCDPAIAKTEKNDRAVICVAGILEDGTVYFAPEWSTRDNPNAVRDTIDKYFELCKLFQPTYHGFEANAFQAAIQNLLTNEMPKHNYFFEPIPIVNSVGKTKRIAGNLLPRVSAGFTIWHPTYRESLTYQEAISWDPLEKENNEDDGIDACTGAIMLLEPHHMLASDHSEDDPDFEDEYQDIDLVMGEDWRIE